MRRFVKNNILELLNTMFESHIEVYGCLADKNYQGAQSILAECQNAALGIGNLIEENEGESAVTIQYLEEYCNAAYEVAVSFLNEKKIDKKLQIVKDSVINDIKETLEVVFLPYNASMWDSMESVWRENSSNPDIDTYVVPIPYYDKNPDGSIKNWYCDAEKFPSYVPITSWEKYDLEGRNPDIVYIHNPYDQFNTVTSVHPKFYSKELKKHTDELIYIPYFVMLGKVPDYMIKLPGVYFADKVFVESEDVKNVYVSTYINFVGEAELNNEKLTGVRNVEFWAELKSKAEKKFINVGSPKIKKVRESKLEDVIVPNEWDKLINKENGEKKKVVLYNTSIVAFLNNKDAYLIKLKSVLTLMKQQEDCVLLWRPHPLLKSTLEASMPELAESYQEIVDEYVREGWGVFDDTSDLTRAILLSDAYYGDGSSVVTLFKETKKPHLIQNPIVSISGNSKDDFVLDFLAGESLKSGKAYVATFNGNGLFEVDLKTEEGTFVEFFPEEELNARCLFSSSVYYDSKIYFIPYGAKNLQIYDLNTHKFASVAIPEPVEKPSFYTENGKFCKGILYNGCLYLLPFTYPGILKYDIENNELSIVDDWVPDEDLFFIGGICVDGSKVYVPNGKSNLVLEFDLETEKAELYKIGIYNNGANAIKKFKDKYVIVPRAYGSVVIWDPKENTVFEINEYPDAFIARDVMFCRAIERGDDLLFIPETANFMLKLGADMKSLEVEDLWNFKQNSRTVCLFETEEDYYFRESCSSGDTRRFKVNKTDMRFDDFEVAVKNCPENKKTFFEESMKRDEAIRETEMFAFDDFLKLL